MLGGSGSINSMVWFRGRLDDFDQWNVKGWTSSEVSTAFEEIESTMTPNRLAHPHVLSERFATVLSGGDHHTLSPERESAGIFHVNMRDGKRWSPADGFLHPGKNNKSLTVRTHSLVNKILFTGNQASGVELADGHVIKANKGVVLSAGAIASPCILMRSGVGPEAVLKPLGIDVRLNSHGVGKNLHDHPAIGIHHAGPNSGYGLTFRQLPNWALAPFNYLFRKQGAFASNIVEAGAFFNATGESTIPDVQTHFMPYMMGWNGRTRTWGAGYYADVGICRPKSRGSLTLKSAHPLSQPDIDIGLLEHPDDLATLIAGFKRLRQLLADAPLGSRRAPEAYPADRVKTDDQIEQHIRDRLHTAYHPVGTLRMGDDAESPVSCTLRVKGTDKLWAADASIMPSVTSANTNAPSIMIGHRAAQLIAEDS